jgi:uncharacterized membrane protein
MTLPLPTSSSAQPSGRSLPLWLRYFVIALLVIGIFFRFLNLDRKLYWYDEIYTSLGIAGYSRTELIREVVTGEVIDAAFLQRYQHLTPERDWGDTWHALKSIPEMPPLYFLLTRLWVQIWGNSIAHIRSLSAVFGVLALPCLAWFCWELFRSAAVTWVGVGLMAIAPFHILYAQEARPYSLWTVTILLSSAALLWSIRATQRHRWVVYGLTVALGFYTQLLFALVALAHGCYVAIIERVIQKRSLNATVWSYLMATLGGLLAFTPWIIVLIDKAERMNSRADSLKKAGSIVLLLQAWGDNIGRSLVGFGFTPINIILSVGVIYLLHFLYHRVPKRSALLLLLLIGIPFLSFAIPDIFLGGRGSARTRYLIPCYLGLQITLAYLLTTQILWGKALMQKISRAVLIALTVIWIAVAVVSSQSYLWWNKSFTKSDYVPIVVSLINQAEKPLVISDGNEIEVLVLSYNLAPKVKLQLVDNPTQLRIPQGFDSLFLLNPSKKLRRTLNRRGYTSEVLYRDPLRHVAHLWLLQKH